MSETTGMPMPAPAGAEHERLDAFVGKFRAEVKMWMGPGDPMVSTGTMTSTRELDGRFLCQEYVGDPGPGPFPNFRGKGLFGYNDLTERYEGVWIDNASNVMQTETGILDESGKVWTMEGSMPCASTGKTTKKRSVLTVRDRDHHSLEMYFENEGGMHKGMEIRYARVS